MAFPKPRKGGQGKIGEGIANEREMQTKRETF